MLARFTKITTIGLIACAISACSGTRPANLGEQQSSLAPCPESPNCVNSQTDPADTEHAIAAITSTDPAATIKAIAAELANHPAEIIVQGEHYIYAEFTSSVMRYVDDVEFLYIPGEQGIQVRSASRLGYKDFGVNRERIEAIRSAVTK